MKYSLVVIGGGSGGLVAAELAAKLGARVALVEASDVLGGECLHAGCVPSKALIKAARDVATVRGSSKYGLTADQPVDFVKVMDQVHGAIKYIQQRSDNDTHYRDMGVDVFHGKAEFKGKDTITAGTQVLRADKFIIATGSSPFVPAIEGLGQGDYLTNETIFELRELPPELVVLGGGPIGVELGQAFAMLGSKVTIIHNGNRLLQREDPAASELLQKQLVNDGVSLVFNANVTEFDSLSKQLTYEHDGRRTLIAAPQLLIATGRTANLDLSLDTAAVEATDKGIRINRYLQTSNPGIYAIGDCTGAPQFTHLAAEQAGVAVRNALYPLRKKAVFPTVPWATFTTPEIATAGKSEADLTAKRIAFTTHTINYDDIDRAMTEQADGFIKLFVDTRQRIIGATIVGENAGELIAQLNSAIWQQQTLEQLARPIRVYPTFSIGIKQLASDVLVKQAADNNLLRLIRK